MGCLGISEHKKTSMGLIKILSKFFPKTVTIRREIVVNSSQKNTWAALVALDRWPIRDSYIASIKAASSNPSPDLLWAAGYSYREQVHRGPFGIFRPTFNLTVGEVDKGNYRIMWWARYLLTRGEHSWQVEKGETENTSTLISEEIFRGPRAFLAIAIWLFYFFDVNGMTDKQLSFIALDAERIKKT